MLHLGLGPGQQKVQTVRTQQASGQGVGRFLLPLGECEFQLETAIDELQARCFFPIISPHALMLPTLFLNLHKLVESME